MPHFKKYNAESVAQLSAGAHVVSGIPCWLVYGNYIQSQPDKTATLYRMVDHVVK